ncbi:MAG: CO dehydrogenase/CO-methylating acetyl-CoA synthase complex subunit beta [Armatimonadia bacterium]|nr:CO dehydrogenase/CO-methylating acetyl-CoA synthase complex subunit beta [Armatimonadia bacterium]
MEIADVLDLAGKGSQALLKTAEERAANVDGGTAVAFKGTAHGLPLLQAICGDEAVKGSDLPALIERFRGIADGSDKVGGRDWSPVERIGISAALTQELIACLENLDGPAAGDGWLGFLPDELLRALGVQLVDGRIAGITLILGASADSADTVEIVRRGQERQMIVALGGRSNGTDALEQLRSEGVDATPDTFVVPLSPDLSSVAYALNFMVRAALIYGRGEIGNAEANIDYCRERVPACAVALGELTPEAVALAASAITFGVPVVSDQPVPTLEDLPESPGPALTSEVDPSAMVQTASEARGIKVQVAEVDVPVMFGPAFEGERVRKEDLQAQFGGKYTQAFEHLYAVDMDEIEDGDVEIVGKDIDEVQPGDALPLGLIVRVAGRNMVTSYESVLERHIHTFVNYICGVMHMGQRESLWVRIGKSAYGSGFRLEHVGKAIHAMMHRSFGEFVDRVAVTVITDGDKLSEPLARARESYTERDARMAEMTDESVSEFYSCALCQSFAPNHVCIVKPERMGLCGAYTWLDAKVSHEMDPTGPNQPVAKGEVLDEERGEWQGVNDFITGASNDTIDRFHAYSMMTFPETSCGCFECILSVVPEVNGVLVVHREFPDDTPQGMSFGLLAGTVGGGVQSPGFMGVAKKYLASPKFIRAEGGLARVVWMPSELKAEMRAELQERAEDLGIPDLLDRIADETVATNLEELQEHLQKHDHPAVTMGSLI